VLKRLAVIVAWVVATFATATITLAAVGRAGGEVSDRPAVPISGVELAARFATATTTIPGSTTVVPTTLSPTIDTTLAGGSTTTDGSTTTGGSTTTTRSGTTTTTPAPTTTTAPVATTTAASQTFTYEQENVGRVTIKVEGSKVTYVSSVVLGSRYSAHLEPEDDKVVVEFEGDESPDYTFTAEVKNGSLQAGFASSGHDD